MTLEEALKEIETLKEQVTTLTSGKESDSKKIKQLNDESASRRVTNSENLKKLYVASKVLEKNNIKVDIDKVNRDNITINSDTGEIEGDVSYDPSSSIGVGAGSPVTSPGTSGAITIEAIQGMSRDEIAKNWDAVSEVIANSAE